jgi:hypothetical protein
MLFAIALFISLIYVNGARSLRRLLFLSIRRWAARIVAVLAWYDVQATEDTKKRRKYDNIYIAALGYDRGLSKP